MADTNAVYKAILRILIESTLIACSLTGLAAYLNRNEPATGFALLVMFVIVWVVSLPVTVGSELGLLVFKSLKSSRANRGPGPSGPVSNRGHS